MLEGDTQVQARLAQVEEMIRRVCDEDEFPWFVSDEATIFDVSTLAPDEMLERLASHYGRKVQITDLTLPIWKLVDQLFAES
jgi:hypothetical protein